jgi:peptidoglycan hydrolase-like protein with peptidoglycan-binding domain
MHTVTILFPQQTNTQEVYENLEINTGILTESISEAYSFDYENGSGIEYNLHNTINENKLEELVEEITMRLFDLGLNDFELEISESLLTEATLRRGNRGDEVKVLQQQLKDLGFDPGPIDGIFGGGTETALKAFQRRAGITVDGLAGGQTQAAIASMGSPRNAGNLRRGGDWENQEGTPGNPRKVTRLRVGQLNDYVFDYTPELYRKYIRTHEVVTISDFGNRNNPKLLLPRLNISGTPPGNPEGPLYTSQGIRLNRDPGPSRGDLGPMADINIDRPSEAESRQKIAQLIRDRKYAQALAAVEFDERITLTSEQMAALRKLAEPRESIEEQTYDDDDKFYEDYGVLYYNEDEELDEAEYQGRKVKLGKPMQGDVKKFKVYVKNPKGNVVKVNFGQKGAKIKKSNAARRKSFRARHNCANPGPRHKARYWSCRKW